MFRFSLAVYPNPKIYIRKILQSNTNNHLWMLNYSKSSAWTNSITFRPANNKLMQFENIVFVYIWISKVMRLGQKDRNILLRDVSDNLITNIRMQNRIRISRAGDGFSDFITSFKDSRTTLSLFSYLSTLPEKMTKQTLSKFLIFTLVDSAFLVNSPSKRPYLERSSPSKS